MYKGQSVAVVITAYNEEDFVGEVIETLPSFVDRAYAVDDGSTDGTWTEIQRRAMAPDGGTSVRPTEDADDDGVHVVPIRHAENRGAGAAVKTGYRRAYEDEMDVVAVMDGDGQMDPDILDRIIDPVVEGRADYAKGNRLLSREHTEGMGAWRRFGNASLTFLTKIASGYWKTMDPQNGYTAISRRALQAIDIDALYDDYGFLNDLLVTLNTHNMRVADVEMKAVYDDETSTISYSSFIPKVSGLLVRGFLRRLTLRYLVYDFHPLVLLYLLGALGAAGAVGQTGLFAAGAVGLGGFLTGLVPVVLLTGVAVTLAMSFDVMNNEHLELQELVDDAGSRRRRDQPPVVQVSDGGEHNAR